MTRPLAAGHLALAEAIAGVALVGFVDWITGYEVRVFPLYFLPVALVAWKTSQPAALGVSLLSSFAWVLANRAAGRVYSHAFILPINFLTQMVAFSTVGVLVAQLRAKLALTLDLSRRDVLTSLPNRRGFYESAELLFAVARRSGAPITLAYLDLDNFKRVNDEGGHNVGDRALATVAGVLKGHFRASDLVARLGGDEFCILLLGSGAEAARISLERVRELLATTMRGNEWPITASIGAVSFLRPPATLDEALREADALMYRAKSGGKNRVHIAVSDPGSPDLASRESRV